MSKPITFETLLILLLITVDGSMSRYEQYQLRVELAQLIQTCNHKPLSIEKEPPHGRRNRLERVTSTRA